MWRANSRAGFSFVLFFLWLGVWQVEMLKDRFLSVLLHSFLLGPSVTIHSESLSLSLTHTHTHTQRSLSVFEVFKLHDRSPTRGTHPEILPLWGAYDECARSPVTLYSCDLKYIFSTILMLQPSTRKVSTKEHCCHCKIFPVSSAAQREREKTALIEQPQSEWKRRSGGNKKAEKSEQ